MIPHPEKADRGGEDAYFANSRVLSAADGVGGWASHGINPAHYSRKLCKNVEQFVEADWPSCKRNPKKIIQYAWANNKEQGSSTLVVVTIPEDEAKIYASYVGDSGYMILRPTSSDDHELVYSSQSQQKGFNFPFQLGWGNNGDHYDVALSFEHSVQNGDLVIVGTDGLFDNLSPDYIRKLVQKEVSEKGYESNRVAEVIGKEAYRLSLDTAYKSPFALEAMKAGYRFNGGKSDDITVVVGKVSLRNVDAASTDL